VAAGNVELYLSTLWQCFHQSLHRLGVARWFVHRAGGFFGAGANAARKDIAINRREAAKAYHQLHQVHLTTENGDHVMGIYLAAAAVNMVESCSQDSLPGNFRSHVYALLALRLKHSAPRFFRHLSSFYMFKAKSRQRKNEAIDANLGWLLSKAGQDFFANSKWHFGQETTCLTEEPDALNPICLVGRYFREERLQRGLAVAVCPGAATGGSKVLDALTAVREAEESNSAVDVGVLAPCQDQTSRWWASAVAAAAHWMMDEVEEAAKLYQNVETYPVSDSHWFSFYDDDIGKQCLPDL